MPHTDGNSHTDEGKFTAPFRAHLKSGDFSDEQPEVSPVVTNHAITFDGSRFWVTHRRRDYGPFDYEWSRDFAGVELLYQGQKFGEYCSREEIYADLQPFALPRRVVEVACITLGAVIYGVINGLDETHKRWTIYDHLTRRGLDRFAQQIRRQPFSQCLSSGGTSNGG